jgi:prepilin-type N-terminal cleavage/methylation domain-containing protein
VGDDRGFSLIELLVVMAITAVIAAAMVAAVASAAGAERRALDMRENTDTARLALERVRDNIRGSFGVCDGSTASSVTVWLKDINGNDRVDANELLTFSIVGGQLLRTDGSGTPRVLVTNLGSDSSFDYRDRAGSLATTPVVGAGLVCPGTAVVEGRGDIATLEVSLAGDRAPDGRTSPTIVSTQIALRNAAMADGTINANRPPTAIFTHSCSGQSCSFNASESYDEDGSIASYNWNFGDGSSIRTGERITHFYPGRTSYPASLTVIDNGGASHTMTQFVAIPEGNATPSASFTVSCVGLTCSFDASASFDIDGTIQSYDWDFGDTQSGTGVTVSHTYAEPGAYPVSLSVLDNLGAVGTQVETANPTTSNELIVIAQIEDISTRSGNSVSWTPAVSLTVRYPDGAPADNVRINGRFGPENSTDLKSAQTNREGTVTLQANGKVDGATYLFIVLSIDGHTITNPTGAGRVLTRPL